jgi:signal transduction histidine kinase
VRSSLIVTVAAAVSMVLLAMLVPMGVLLQDYALEDRLSRAALEVQATETVVSGQDYGAVSNYLDRINTGEGITTTVFYPDGTAIGPSPVDDPRIGEARRTGQARVDDVADGAAILIPVSLGGNTVAADQTPVIRVEVDAPGPGSGVFRAWGVLAVLGALLLVGALVLADRLGRSFVQPILGLAAYTKQLGDERRPEPVAATGPAEIRQLGVAINRLVDRVEVLLKREREHVSDLSHRLRTPVTALRLRIDSLPESPDRDRLSADLDELRALVDQAVREARRSEREGLVPEVDAAAVLTERASFWRPLAEDQGRPFTIEGPAGGHPVRASSGDLAALLDVLLDNVFTHTPDGASIEVRMTPRAGGGLVLVVEDGGPGFTAAAVERGVSDAGSTGLGLSIAAKTATESGGGLRVGSAAGGGGRVEVELGPPV